MKRLIVLLLALCLSGVSFAAASGTKKEIVALYNAAKLSGPGSVNDLVGPAPLFKYNGVKQRMYKKGEAAIKKEYKAWEAAVAQWGERYLGVMMLATKQNDIAFVKELLKHKANTDKKSVDQLALSTRFTNHVLVAVETDNVALLEVFLDRLVSMYAKAYPLKAGPLHHAALNGASAVMPILLDYAEEMQQDDGTWQEVFPCKQDLNKPDERGLTPLDYANISVRNGTATQERYEAIKALLLAAGATGKSEAELDEWDREFQADSTESVS